MYALDTNAIIYYIKEEASVVSVIERIYAENVPIYLSAMTVAELFIFPRLNDEEAGHIESFLQSVSIISMDSYIARNAGVLGKNHHLDIADSVIAATALFTGSTLLTRNIRDFRKIPQLKIQKV